ncbi:MAG: D-isomer specific 2-hydroxyacid dehydrogenase, NAD-binding [Candidatus Solibacter sp.]|nr:D-isomer specific 2-hydroxyacid dehydrogenase, NAD-binding [Candidatus Solibacter sp.]
MPRICIPDDYPPVLAPSAVFPALQSRAQLDYYDTLPGTEDALIARIADAEAALNIRSSSFFTERVFAACPQLRLVSIWGTGTDHVDLASAARHNVAVANTPGVSARSIAEHTLALLFAVARRIPHMDAATRRGVWERGQSIELYGKTAGILGYGAVGREFARLALGIGMKVITWTMHPEHYAGVPFTDLDDLYRAADVVSVHLRLSPETRSFIAAPQFASMKPGAILINTARGAIVDEPSLLHALSTGPLAAAGLDVFAHEPLPPTHPLTTLPNVVLTPHCAGITPEALQAGLQMAVDNIWKFLPPH